MHARKQSERRRKIIGAEKRGQHVTVYVRIICRVLPKRFQLGAKYALAVKDRPIQRLDAKTVAAKSESMFLGIPERKGKHAIA